MQTKILLILILISINPIFSLQKIFKTIYKSPIKIWQKISYSTPLLDCQFKPSCSNYFIHAVDSVGIIPGTIIGTDRIVRCNPAAMHYHYQQKHSKLYHDGRIIDFVSFKKQKQLNKKSLKYALIPGLGRYKIGRGIDGVFSFLMVTSSIYKGFHSINEYPYKSGFYFTIGSIFWIADFYGTWRISNSK